MFSLEWLLCTVPVPGFAANHRWRHWVGYVGIIKWRETKEYQTKILVLSGCNKRETQSFRLVGTGLATSLQKDRRHKTNYRGVQDSLLFIHTEEQREPRAA